MLKMLCCTSLSIFSYFSKIINATQHQHADNLVLQAGVVSSSNNLGYSEQDMAQILENDAAVKEMEGAAIAWAAHLFEVPVLALKSITDIVDGDRPPKRSSLRICRRLLLP